MILRAVDSNGDWVFGNGKQAYRTNNDAIMLNIEMKLKTFLSECFFDNTVGVAWFDLIPQTNKDVITLSIKTELMKCWGVLRVTQLQYDFELNRELTIKYAIETIYQTLVLGTVTI